MGVRSAMIKREDKIDITDEPSVHGMESTINSTDAIDMVSHSSDFVINLTTPIGVRYVGKTKFIGRHSDNFLLLEMPKLSETDLKFFFQVGFWMNIKAIFAKGEGALIHFRTQIVHVLKTPIPMLVVSIPSLMKINQLREEPRYDVNLKAQALSNSIKLECKVRDLSKGGCRFITSPLTKYLDMGDKVLITLAKPGKSKLELMPLSGVVCNLQRSMHYAKYGLKFDETSRTQVKSMLEYMKFDVIKLELKF